MIVIASGSLAAQPPAQDGEPPTADVFDLVRKLRNKDQQPEAALDYRKPMTAFAPVIGAKPSSGVLLGAAGNVAFYRGDPATTHISSAVASLTLSTKGQTAITNRFTMFAPDDHWRMEGNHRLQWSSLETHSLGTSTDTRDGVETDYDFSACITRCTSGSALICSPAAASTSTITSTLALPRARKRYGRTRPT
jgi:hypothetical protein